MYSVAQRLINHFVKMQGLAISQVRTIVEMNSYYEVWATIVQCLFKKSRADVTQIGGDERLASRIRAAHSATCHEESYRRINLYRSVEVVRSYRAGTCLCIASFFFFADRSIVRGGRENRSH